jgi:hypothetical protein
MLWCSSCHGPHAKADCPRFKEIREVPLETPSHNGTYQGTLQVRTVAPGESGEDEANGHAKEKGDRGRMKRTLSALGVRAICKECEQPFDKHLGWHRKVAAYCSNKCQLKAYRRKQKAMKNLKTP